MNTNWTTLASLAIIIWISLTRIPLLRRTAIRWIRAIQPFSFVLWILMATGSRQNLLQLLLQRLYQILPYSMLTENLVLILAWLGLCQVFTYFRQFSFHQSFHRIFEYVERHSAWLRQRLDQETVSFRNESESLLQKDPRRSITVQLPAVGRRPSEILGELELYAHNEEEKWRKGKTSGTVYAKDETYIKLSNDAYALYALANPLHPGQWPKLNQCEGELIAMTANLLNAPASYGCITSGGTESILLSIRAHLVHYGRARGITNPEIICGSTAHASVLKAAEIFGIHLVMIDCNDGETFQLKPNLVRNKITPNTTMIFASTPCYPQGTIDPIEDLSQIALQYDIGFHVDACMGGFILAFAPDAPKFDFRCPGVTAMSIDQHKYGLSSKGVSTVLYRDPELRRAQYFVYPRWTGGLYATPTFAGSRAGGLVVSAWATMMAMGKDKYTQSARIVIGAARKMADQIALIKDLKVLNKKPYMIVSFASDSLDIYRVQKKMIQLGWAVNSMQNPASLHFGVTPNSASLVDEFIDDLQTAVRQVKEEALSGQSSTSIYGTVNALPPGPVEFVLKTFTDMTLAP